MVRVLSANAPKYPEITIFRKQHDETFTKFLPSRRILKKRTLTTTSRRSVGRVRKVPDEETYAVNCAGIRDTHIYTRLLNKIARRKSYGRPTDADRRSLVLRNGRTTLITWPIDICLTARVAFQQPLITVAYRLINSPSNVITREARARAERCNVQVVAGNTELPFLAESVSSATGFTPSISFRVAQIRRNSSSTTNDISAGLDEACHINRIMCASS